MKRRDYIIVGIVLILVGLGCVALAIYSSSELKKQPTVPGSKRIADTDVANVYAMLVVVGAISAILSIGFGVGALMEKGDQE